MEVDAEADWPVRLDPVQYLRLHDPRAPGRKPGLFDDELEEADAVRFIHLAAHPGPPAFLTDDQIARDGALLGYRAHRHGTDHRGHRSTRP